jgi:hypothetical protein
LAAVEVMSTILWSMRMWWMAMMHMLQDYISPMKWWRSCACHGCLLEQLFLVSLRLLLLLQGLLLGLRVLLLVSQHRQV